MTGARDEIISRIRLALADRPATLPTLRAYRGQVGQGDVQRFIDRVSDYKATVHLITDQSNVRSTTSQVLAARGHRRVAIPDGFPDHWKPSTDIVCEPIDIPTLDEVNAVATTCRIGIAETGTIVLDTGPGMGPRAMSLVPDYHLVVIDSAQIVAGVPDALPLLDPVKPLTWISGPSATSDIELHRVEGVHGPRTLDVVIVRSARDHAIRHPVGVFSSPSDLHDREPESP